MMDLIKALQVKTNITVDLKVWTCCLQSYGYAVGNFHENIYIMQYIAKYVIRYVME